ncbi:MAG TPA: MerR family transcriptional regulator [Chitinophagaceae bacterium]|jgi:DNA-binding transcriptional MerR regulator|nr:MerR family transcriptional regulator [Chitinophagaceae bacterium]
MAFTIKDLETLSGIKAHTIRIWEQRYSFLQPARTPTNIRTYSNDDLKTLLTVSLLNKYGYKISRISDMAQEERNRTALHLLPPDAQVEYLVNELIGCMIDMKVAEFEKMLDDYIARHGLFDSITSLIFTFLEKVGMLWQTDRVNPAHEHIVTCLIRQKIVSAINDLPAVAGDGPQFLLLLPEGEHHELGLLFVHFLLRKAGIPLIYLGANVPVKDTLYVVRAKRPRYLYIHLTAMPTHFNFQRYLTALAAGAPASTLLFSGAPVQSYKKEIPSNVQIFKSLSDVLAYISRVRR